MGRNLQVKSVSSPELVAQVETVVNEKLAEAAAAVSGADSQIVSILAMMNLAEAFLSAQKELEKEREACRTRISALIDKLDGAV
ncbi:cell division protein ZapA [Geomonas sp.]|uniref:cell division protein ZapA n=1 Tax=Geomonas sp. TaxID=2651584 RepID=UPI002B4983A7|nr:cell division protein ZapA [Geomonas sp.]HJV36554.1 cell division protein ZapA [Geomonas sp.]